MMPTQVVCCSTWTRLTLVAGLATALIWSDDARSADIELFPGDNFEAVVESLQPGDTVTVHEGTYTTTGRISIQVKGTASNPVVIQGAPGEARPHITRPDTAQPQNTINVEGATYLTIRGLEISSNGGDGVNLNSVPSFITLEDLDIHDIDIGLNFRSDMHDIIVRDNHIYRTARGGGPGEGMYVGCNDAVCAVWDSVFERNWVHDTLTASQGDGIEIKKGSHSNIIRDNVIHDTNWPCILLYGTEGNPRNIVEGNVMWNCGDGAIQVAADAVIRNNILIESPGAGLNSGPHQGATPNNLEFVHNTVVSGNPCVRLSGWDSKQGMVFANNAIYCDGNFFSIFGLNGVDVSGNVIVPNTSAFPSSGYTSGRSAAQDFLDVVNRNLYPTADSPLIDAGNAVHQVPVDFNGTVRSGPPDAGAYTWSGANNPGWQVGPGFKGGSASQGPTVSLTANPNSVPYEGTTELSWTTQNAVSCTAMDDWSGTRATSGQEMVGPLTTDSTFTLMCDDAAGVSWGDTENVQVVLPGVPTLSFSANPDNVQPGGKSMLSWDSTDATSCDASGDWNGPKDLSGDEEVGPLDTTSTYTMSCQGAGGDNTRSVTVQVSGGGGGGGGGTGGGGGNTDSDSGSTDPLWLSLLAAWLAIRGSRKGRPVGV